MGLLSDPEYGSVKWVKVLKKVHRPVCYLCYLGAIVWFVMLGNRNFNNETYFSENALLPGLVTNEFNAENTANKFFTEFQQELVDKYDDTDEMPVSWLVAKMSQLHLQVFTHNFTLKYPLGVVEQTFHGTNVYGILRAPRTSSQEAIVVSAPYRALNNHQKGTHAGIALMLAFAQFARPQKYWAKDIIFLVTQYEQLGMQAWLEAYHGLKSDKETFYTSLGSFWKPGSLNLGEINGFSWNNHQKCLDPGKLKGRSGSIQAAINLEFHTPKIKYVEVKVEGLNGQLPNLDLVNLVHKLCVKAGVHHSYKNSYSWIRIRNKMDDWANNLWTMLGMISTQMAGVPSGNHGLFHRFNIEAVTLEGRDARDPAGVAPKVNSLGNCNFHRLGLTLESVLRSINNLLERFHQSYFFYLLASTNRFISIGQYMPSLCLMCVAMLIRALYLWVSIQQDEETVNKQTDKKTNKKTDKPTQEKPDQINEKEKKCDDAIENDDKSDKVKESVNKQTDKKTDEPSQEKPDEINEKDKKCDEAIENEDKSDKVKESVNKQTDKKTNKKTGEPTQEKPDEIYEKDKKCDEAIENDDKSDKVKKSVNKQTDKNTNKKTDEPTQEKPDEINEKDKKCDEAIENDDKSDKVKESDEEVLGDNKSEMVLRKRHKKKDLPVEDEIEKTSQEKEAKLDSETKVPGPKKCKAVNESSMSVVNIGANYLLVHLIGYGMTNTPIIFSAIGSRFDVLNENAIFYGLGISSIVIAIASPFLPRLLRKSPISREEITLVNILLLVELATVCLTVGMHNFSLGLILATVYTPLALVVDVARGKSGVSRKLKQIFCLILQPLSVLSLSMIAYSTVLFPEDSIATTLGRGTEAVMQAVMFSIVDSLIYGNWLFNLITAVVFPMWILFWQLANSAADMK